MPVLKTLVALILLVCTCGAHAADKPNVIFILCDDLGYGDVGVFYQNQRASLNERSVPFFRTPHIDVLARDGVRLTQHYSSAPVCAPSRASLLTGLTQGHSNVRDNQFDKALADTHTLGTVLKQAGYATAAIGKWGLQGNKRAGATRANNAAGPAVWPAYPTKRGFDYYLGYVRHQDGHFHYPKEDGREVWENDREISAGLDKCYTADLWTAAAKRWIVDQVTTQPAQPFFVFLAYDTPHAKLQNPPSAYPQGGGLGGGVQWTGTPNAMLNSAAGTVDGYVHPDFAEATWDDDRNAATPEVPWPDAQRRYANSVRRIDDGVGDLLQLLKDLKIDDNTLIVFTSDNGPSMESYLENEPFAPTFFRGFGPFDGIKRDTLEGGTREPTLARWPRAIPPGREDNQPSGQWDWLATLAEAAGVPIPAASDGVSLLPSLTGRNERRPSTIYIEYFNNSRTPDYAEFAAAHRKRRRGQMQNIYLNGHMGVRYDIKSADDDFEIYDLTSDPQQAQDLAKDPALRNLQVEMKARVLQVRRPAPDAKRPYDDAAIPPVKEPPVGSQGLGWSLFKGDWPWMPDFGVLPADASGTVKQVELSMASGNSPFGVAFSGYFHARQEGLYTFTLGSDGDAMLLLHDIRLINEPQSDQANMQSGSVRLQAGWHPIRVYYRHTGNSVPTLTLTCQRDGAEKPYPLLPDGFRPQAGAK